MKAWDLAVAFLEAHPPQGERIIANFVGGSVQSLASVFAGVKIYNRSDEKTLFDGGQIVPTLQNAYIYSKQAGLVRNVSVAQLIDRAYVKAALGG